MRIISADQLSQDLAYAPLIDALRDAFAAIGEHQVTTPVRHHHTIPLAEQADATLLLMPAWQSGRYVGIKCVTVYPDNQRRALPSIQGVYLLLDGATGTPLALMDGPELTARRTACASALAARYLARPDARTLLMVGAGVLAPHLIAAHAAVRPLSRVLLWARNPAKARQCAQAVAEGGNAPCPITPVEDLAPAVAEADIISCATLSTEPLILGHWLRPGQHLDLVGAFRPDMRESDDQAVRRSLVFADTRAGARQEGGDLAQPLAAGIITDDHILADLFDLARGDHPGRTSADDITLFKSVGTAIEDLAAAILAHER